MITSYVQTRSCRLRGGGESHHVPADAVVRCTPCHAGRCFKHLLSDGIHAAEAILLSQDKDMSLHWHHRHSAKATAEFVGRQEALLKAERLGLAVPFYKDKLVYLAQNFSSCRPANYLRTKPGWYDVADDIPGELEVSTFVCACIAD